MEKRTIVIGEMNNADGTFESANRVYDKRSSCPTIPTCGGGRYSTENYTSLLHKEEEIVAKSMSRDMTV